MKKWIKNLKFYGRNMDIRHNVIRQQWIDEFSSDISQNFFIEETYHWLWKAEKFIFQKYFTNKTAKILDIWCWTGRTTIPLHNMWFNVLWIDITPKMIENANKIAIQKGLNISYKIWDVTNLQFDNSEFDYALFSNHWRTQIPWSINRNKALNEIHRILRTSWTYIFVTHERKFSFLWFKKWIKFKILKNIWFNISELEYWDIFFKRNNNSKLDQYIYIPTIKEVLNELDLVWFEIIEIEKAIRQGKDIAIFYVCKKI
jgi:SAM-dependent methyltransferase